MYHFPDILISAILIPAVLILALLVFFCIWYLRRKKIIKKVSCMHINEKCKVLDTLLEPFGYSYVPSEDVFTTCIDAWQRQFGYGAFYDKAALPFGMVINSLPVYFNYDNRTWLIEFWKGQYGINTGCEIGVYRADRILNESELDHALFKSVSNEEMPDISLFFYKITQVKEIAQLNSRHWWLTAFKPGLFSIPSNLSVWSSITLVSLEMAYSFYRALIKLGYSSNKITIHRNTVTFTFAGSTPVNGIFHRIISYIAQIFNRLGCRVYLFVTRPFDTSADRVLFLYYYLPFILRRILNIRRFKRDKSLFPAA